VRLSVDGVLSAVGAERKEQVAAWVDDKKQVSAYAMHLHQIDNGVTIRPSGWKCAKCDKVDNLWLNLTDGMILCGRKNWDGTGGNDHALEHYNETNYPLAVKLGTITADLETAGNECLHFQLNVSLFSVIDSYCSSLPLIHNSMSFGHLFIDQYETLHFS
jgi:ubiquitin carboxyl-terminal hydrolase 5/13